MSTLEGVDMPSIPKVAIACQGGGSHAAFAAGVLDHLLGPRQRERFELVSLSGTSGGAMCAALAWRGLIASGPDEARQRLVRFWRDLEVHNVADAIANFWGVWMAALPVEVSPYLFEAPAEPRLRRLLSLHLDLENFTSDAKARARLKLLIGATDVLNGARVIFHGEGLTYDHLIASAAVPPLFRALRDNGRLYWDGLFTTNPPVREFTNIHPRPDEIWVVQINPQRRATEPRSMPDIIDRRNELAGNLSLQQELYFIDKINHLLGNHAPLSAKYKPIQVRIVELELETERLDYPSKVDRRSAFIEELLDVGRKRAELFFDSKSKWSLERSAPATTVHIGKG
jgi:NTE family protein